MLRAEHWTQQRLWPVQCVRIELTIHQLPDKSVSCWAYEVIEPHTKELMALHVQPYVNANVAQGLAQAMTEAVESALVGLLDPDPFP